MNKSFAVVSLAGLLMSGVALAGNPPATPPAKMGTHSASHADFVKLDANKDGYLERNEVRANLQLEKDFDRMAKNGRLTEAEFAAWEMHQTATPAGKQEQMREQVRDPATHQTPAAGGGYDK